MHDDEQEEYANAWSPLATAIAFYSLNVFAEQQQQEEQLHWLTAEYGTSCDKIIHWLNRRM
tara:strand:- start:465 stop:647 length:183 start_codon:yes stop_codon:yes gene_type:complete